MYYHSQNLKKEDGEKGLVHWRCWIGNQPQLTFSISIPSSFWHIDIDLCQNGWQEEAIGFSIATPLCAIWIGLESRWLYKILEPITKRKDQKYTNGRTIGLSIHSGSIWVSLWDDPMESRGKDPWWWHFTITPMDILFGKAKHSETTEQEGNCVVTMPEKDYAGTYKIFWSYWKRPFSPFVKKLRRISVEIPEGIPIPGKGENSWDCDDDATFGVTMPLPEHQNIHDACKQIAFNALKDREKRAGLSWLPRKFTTEPKLYAVTPLQPQEKLAPIEPDLEHFGVKIYAKSWMPEGSILVLDSRPTRRLLHNEPLENVLRDMAKTGVIVNKVGKAGGR